MRVVFNARTSRKNAITEKNKIAQRIEAEKRREREEAQKKRDNK